MKTTKQVLVMCVLAFFTIFLSGCNIWEDRGKTSASNVDGYVQYKNKTINTAVLAPKDRDRSVTIGGVYSIMSPDGDADISVMRSTVEWLMEDLASASTSLENYKAFRLSQLTEDNIGPELLVEETKTTLAGYDAYQIDYSYLPQGNEEKMFASETFTLVEGSIYALRYGGKMRVKENYEDIVEVVKDSYEVVKKGESGTK